MQIYAHNMRISAHLLYALRGTPYLDKHCTISNNKWSI